MRVGDDRYGRMVDWVWSDVINCESAKEDDNGVGNV